jgi:hypothetical protein
MKLRTYYKDRSKWCKKTEAKDSNNRPVPSGSKEIKSMCLLAAFTSIYKADTEIPKRIVKYIRANFKDRVKHVRAFDYFGNIIHFNDHKDTKFHELKHMLNVLDV